MAVLTVVGDTHTLRRNSLNTVAPLMRMPERVARRAAAWPPSA
jgi:hypothetical protein